MQISVSIAAARDNLQVVYEDLQRIVRAVEVDIELLGTLA